MSNHTQDEFNEALRVWLEGAQAISDRNMEQYPNVDKPKIEATVGKKYVRIVRDHSAHA